jgi:hypothetical protein
MTDDTADSGRSPATLLTRLAVLLVVAVAVVLQVGRRRAEQATDRLVATMLAEAGDSDRVLTAEALADLPDPVRRYAETVLEEGQPYVRTARIEQRGEFRLGEGDGPGAWRPLTAVQHVAVEPPGFVWDARIEAVPGLPVRVIDRYTGGEGNLRATLWSVLPVARANSEPAMDEAELLRYLAECVWLPTALLGERVEWEPVDDATARATIRDGETTASLTVHFDDSGLIERVHAAERYRQETGDYAPWTGRFREYRVRNGVLVPTEAEVGWDDTDGPYWRATVESIEYGVDGSTESESETAGEPTVEPAEAEASAEG